MTRTTIREMKKTIRRGDRQGASGADLLAAREAAFRLLERSIRMKHCRLAVLRLVAALDSGGRIDTEAQSYFEGMLQFRNQDAATRALLVNALANARVTRPK